MKSASTFLPASWSRERRSAVTIAIAIFGMVAFLWLLAIPLSWLPSPIGPAAEQFAEGAWVTVQLTAIAGPLGILIGIIVALAKLSRVAPLRWVANFYIWVLRGTPLLVQVLFAFNLELFGIRLSEFNAAVRGVEIRGQRLPDAVLVHSGREAPPGTTELCARLASFFTFASVMRRRVLPNGGFTCSTFTMGPNACRPSNSHERQ